ncbi:urease accessory protein UreD [Pontibacter sp. CAU 1760]
MPVPLPHLTDTLSANWSAVEVAVVRGKSRLVGCRSAQPLKVLNPASHSLCCHVVLSNFGGGMVAGDQVNLRVVCGRGSRTFLSSQSNSKIFKSTDGQEARQTVLGVLERGALAVVFPDPVVLQAESRYRQIQHWELQEQATLLVVDWFHSGRMDMGEQFAFSSFFSEVCVSAAGKPVLLDRFAYRPTQHIATSPANFSRYQTMFSAYLVGTPGEERFEQLGQRLLQLRMPERHTLGLDLQAHDVVLSVVRAKPAVYLLRAMAMSRPDLQELSEALLTTLSDELHLGYNPATRKY